MKLELNHLQCSYGEKIIVNDFSATIESGEIFCLLGPNGIGKTTLFKTILRFLPIKKGTITINDQDIYSYSKKDYARLIGYVPQSHTPPFAYTVMDVVVMGRTAHMDAFGSPGKKDYDFVSKLLERLEIADLKNRKYTELSGGERQMVLIARALAQEPVFLMMDEPTSNLDFGNQVKVIQNIKDLAKQGLGVIMTTHSPDHVFQCNAKVVLMMQDKRYLVGHVSDILSETTLTDTYGVHIAILEDQYQNQSFNFCQPIFESKP
ncbi:ABC transporter ATP-binding protein [Acetobacterium sp. KB-1]|jgi:iron complex transport system ATP-binding protein|uniref:ABC transporter ATP-binding protein n=1 Tax=Acetobacterium TaxID=33951 RepID=UPI000DBEB875|nr:ABC transporter ATP-binding protein [Acetobacterium sp. KB-1]AWW27243.1 ABC transporter ATP-binding protein [Acetobacterium sp. KB-1]